MTRILVIEDETMLREEVMEWLTFEGYEVVGAADGLAGVQNALQQVPDLIICDITMPRLDGHGVLLELRAHPATASVAFIFVTARASHDDIRTGMALGADDYLTKPFNHLELLQAVETRLHKKAIIEQQRQRELEQWQAAFEYEREQRLLKARLVAMFSHDFRNPLATILSSSNILRHYEDRLTPDRKQQHFNQIDGSVRLLLQMLEDMLVIAEMERGHLAYAPVTEDLTTYAAGIIDEFRLISETTHTLHFESTVEFLAEFDPKLFRQILTNLTSNALKYSPAGTVVQVCLRPAGGSIELQVRDHGIGIPQADQVHLFEPFHRAANTGEVKGTGLGLTIVKQAVDLHGGTIDIESLEEAGTTVIVTLPQPTLHKRGA